MARIIKPQEYRREDSLTKISTLAAKIEASNIAEAATMGLEIIKLNDGGYRVTDTTTGQVRRKRLRDLDRFVDMERDRLANALGFPSAYYLRTMQGVAHGEKTTHAYARALRYLMTTIIGEAA
ncbi:hypothetical protein [Pedomonas mirosovicensis]|uniref:hypothetical protein n=1 Tax=Pedomonas mirosovicensis TaxID=2908641 RepID=UPI0021681127|nr:hypothetical protein [Pedomonas mirosovicensis]MCH8685878.1 hypothetical protein [Pedomonas mirosovicensis]